MPITRELVAQPGNQKIKIVLDHADMLPERELWELLLGLNKQAIEQQNTHPEKGGAQLFGVTTKPEGLHFVYTGDMLLLTESQEFAEQIWDAVRRRSRNYCN